VSIFIRVTTNINQARIKTQNRNGSKIYRTIVEMHPTNPRRVKEGLPRW
jgi:hypothetical protein